MNTRLLHKYSARMYSNSHRQEEAEVRVVGYSKEEMKEQMVKLVKE